MRPVSTGVAVRAQDRAVIETLGLPGIALMEVASRAVAHEVRALGASVVDVVCGSGNNGGDGWGVARWLHGWGLSVRVLEMGSAPTGDAQTMRAVALASGVPTITELRPDAHVVVDALFGTGLSRPIVGELARAVEAMNASPSHVVAVDVPSGLCADRGTVLGVAVQAHTTVTFQRAKLGFFGIHRGLVGAIRVVDIGLDVAEAEVQAHWMEPSDLSLPVRAATAHKTRSGHVTVVAGSTAMAGAAMLACRGALALGAGLVSLVTPRGALPRLAQLPEAVMWVDGGAGDVLQNLPELPGTALVVGPGLGGGQPLPEGLFLELGDLWRSDPRPILFDADALAACTATKLPRVLTPHPGEAARMLQDTVAGVQADRVASAQELSRCGVALLKGPTSLIAGDDSLAIVEEGSSVLATGGSGDVLAGAIGALLGLGLEPLEAARQGCLAHALAGKRLAQRRMSGWTARDIADELATTSSHLP